MFDRYQRFRGTSGTGARDGTNALELCPSEDDSFSFDQEISQPLLTVHYRVRKNLQSDKAPTSVARQASAREDPYIYS
jgi:hypothetical protein